MVRMHVNLNNSEALVGAEVLDALDVLAALAVLAVLAVSIALTALDVPVASAVGVNALDKILGN